HDLAVAGQASEAIRLPRLATLHAEVRGVGKTSGGTSASERDGAHQHRDEQPGGGRKAAPQRVQALLPSSLRYGRLAAGNTHRAPRSHSTLSWASACISSAAYGD